MTFTYLLRGIDLPSIFILLAFNFIIIAASIQCAILIGCFPTSRVFKVILGVIWLNIVGTIFSSTIGLSVLLSGQGDRESNQFLGILASRLECIGRWSGTYRCACAIIDCAD